MIKNRLEPKEFEYFLIGVLTGGLFALSVCLLVAGVLA